MDQWIDNASFGHFFALAGAGFLAGFFGVILYDLIAARIESQIGIAATGAF